MNSTINVIELYCLSMADIQTSPAVAWRVHLDRKAVCAKTLWKTIQAFNVSHLFHNKNSSDEENVMNRASRIISY